ncbi:hypothetical protein HRI_004876400 [Hibiscus trionum]|uniref:Cytochrome P450 n=1 Tax=Hibiscus trionum TaxID=183268 RepID=A0A9W7MT83_HIBTR|nr:hypothetical protein HRI_004876400 [Hibiscus trionum]
MEKYQDPLTFNPSRWEQGEINGASKNFMAFGDDIRFCIGADFAKVQMVVFQCFSVIWLPSTGGNRSEAEIRSELRVYSFQMALAYGCSMNVE